MITAAGLAGAAGEAPGRGLDVALADLLGDELLVRLLRLVVVGEVLLLCLAGVPILPNVTVKLRPCSSMFQNLFDVPSVN